MPSGGGGDKVIQSLIGQEFNMVDEIPPSDWPISNWFVIGHIFKMADGK